jgi:Ca-activated chloride channel family protein
MPAFAQSGSTLLAQGNEKFRAKDFEAAADLYHQAQSAKNAPAAKALYNEGCAFLEQGKPAEAADRFREADAKAGADRDLSARARFNLGQSLFKQAEPLKDQQPDQALDLLRQSAAAYRSVLDAAPADAEAPRNVEIARHLMRQIEDKKREQQKQDQKNQQQNQKGGKGEKGQQGQGGEPGDEQQQEQQRQADQLKDLAKRQRRAAAESQKAEQNSPDQWSAGERQKQQQGLKEDTAKAEIEQKESGGSESDQLKNAQEEQQKALDELGKQNPGAAKRHQEAAAKALEQAAKEAQDKADQTQKHDRKDGKEQGKDQGRQDGKDGPGQSAQQGNTDPKKDQNYDKTAAALLDRERKLHQQRQPVIRAARGTGAPVEKDW